MGGELEIVARFGQRTVKIRNFADLHREPEITAGMLRSAKAGADKDKDRSPRWSLPDSTAIPAPRSPAAD